MQPGTDDRDGQDDGRHNTEADTREQVIREGVAEEALDHAQEDERATDDPVSLTRAAERTGEEDAEHVRDHGHHEQQGCPVVHLADKQATANLEGKVQSRCVCGRHLHTVERCVGAVVDDLRDRRVEEEGQVDTGQQEDDEAVERHLTEHEGPVGREDLVQLRTNRTGQRETAVYVVANLCEFIAHYDLRSQ